MYQKLIDEYELNLATDWFWFKRKGTPFYFSWRFLKDLSIEEMKAISTHVGNKIQKAKARTVGYRWT